MDREALDERVEQPRRARVEVRLERFARAGQHFVVFVEDTEQVIIVDFLHSRADLPRRLANLPLPKGDREH